MPTTQTKTIKSSGGDYSGIIAYEAAEQANLVTGDLIKQAECYTFEDVLGTTASGLFDGWTTDATRYIRVYAATGHQHSCKAYTGYRIAFDGFGRGIDIREEYMRVEGIGFRSFDAGSSPGDRAFHIENAASGDVRISKCWLNTFTNDESFIRAFGSTSGVKIFNNMAHVAGTGTASSINTQGNGTYYMYNNSLVGQNLPDFISLLYVSSGNPTYVLKNNLVDRGPNPNASSTAYGLSGATTTGSTNNLSDDTTAPGSNAQTSKNPVYRNETAGDLRLLSNDTTCKSLGADLDADANIAITDDILGTARHSTAPTIGAFEIVTPSAAITGTATASINESDIVAGGKTVIATLTNDTYPIANGTPVFLCGTTKGTASADGRANNGALTINFPSGYQPIAGDLGIILLYSDQGSGSVPTDWAEISGSPFGAGTDKLQIFTKTFVGGEPAPSTTISGSTTNASHCGNMAVYPDGQIGAIGTASNGTGTPMTANAITTTDDNSVVLGCCGRGDNENASGQTFNASSTGVTEQLDGGTGAGNDSQVSMADKTIASSGTSSGNFSATTSATDPWVCVIIEVKRTTPFAGVRSAIATGLDSAQSEAAGWDAKVKPNIPVANVVRTSDTVVTVTLQAQADYDITAQETITWTVPASALLGGVATVGSPTFTVDTGGAAGIVGKSYIKSQAVNRAATY